MQDDELIDLSDARAVEGWAARFCCTPAELLEAVQAVGPRTNEVKRHLFKMLLQTCLKRPSP